MTIEEASVADAGEILVLQRAAYVADAQLYGDPFIGPLVESAAQIERAIAGAGLTLLCRDQARLVGLLRAAYQGETFLISRLATAPDRQRTGIATTLLSAAEAIATAGGATVATTMVGHLSEPGLRLFARAGYRQAQRERMAPHLTLVHLRRELPH